MLIFFDQLAKRILDIVLALIALILIMPLWLILVFLIRKDSSGPIFYIHTRVGKDEKLFKCFKFRTMKTGSDPHRLAESKEDDRITNIGKFLRNTSLDETPQLINVLIGEMSIVGPRPALEVQVKNFSDEEKWKLNVKPGITGWTQVNGRNSIPYERRMELDVWYARNHNIFLDIWIIIKTFKVIIAGDGVYDKNSTSPTQ